MLTSSRVNLEQKSAALEPANFRHSFLAQTAQLGCLSLFLWLAYVFVLGPFWGWHLFGMGDWILERAKFLSERGFAPHPILQVYKDLSLRDIWLAGSLLGALFLAWPMALWMALGEVLAARCNLIWSLALRGVWAYLLFLAWGQNLSVYIKGFEGQICAFSLVFLMPFLLRRILEGLEVLAQLRPARSGPAILASAILMFPLLIHPVWGIWLRPTDYSKVKSMPLARDWLLLDQNGESLINSWYYGSSPILMEKERVTSFQPMVVGLLNVDESVWKNRLSEDFQVQVKRPGQRMAFVHLDRLDDYDLWLERGLIDYVAIGASERDAQLSRSNHCPLGSVGFYAVGDWALADGQLQFDVQHFYSFSKQDQRRETPLTKRRDELRKQGYLPLQSQCLDKNKGSLIYLMGRPMLLMGIVGLMIWGLAYYLAKILNFIFSVTSWWGMLLLFLVLPNVGWFGEVFEFWSHPHGSDTIWAKIADLHLRAIRLSKSDLEMVLAGPLSSDRRIGMLQVSVLGRSFQRSTLGDQAKIVQKFESLLPEYAEMPLNFRYKMVDAMAGIPELMESLDLLMSQEQHPYVRWYAADRGIGLK